MECEEFLQSFSDYLDAEFEKHPRDEYTQHIEVCAECGEYDRVMRRGLRLVRELDMPEPVPDFMPRLQRNVLAHRDRSEVVAAYAKAAGIAGLTFTGVMLLASMPRLRLGGGTLELPPVIVEVETSVDRSHSLWGPPPNFAVPASFMTAPSLTEGPLLRRPAQRFSLFREPVRSTLGGASRRASAKRVGSEPVELTPE